jgi:methyltransferase
MGSSWNGRRLSVAIPASLVSDTPHLREKTGKLGSIARACSIFGATRILLYPDDSHRNQETDLELSMEILRFIETPQYLRKRIFRLSENLRYTGVLPPLQTPPHDVAHSIHDSNVGDLREGIIVGRRGNSMLVDVGLEQAFECKGDSTVGRRVTVRITGLEKNPKGELAGQTKEQRTYWGYEVAKANSSLCKLVEGGKFDLVIGTSRYGSDLASLWPDLVSSLKSAMQTLVVFGSPRLGLTDILKQENKTPQDVFDYFVNTVPNQNVSTVRTEEAILISLGIFNLATSIY